MRFSHQTCRPMTAARDKFAADSIQDANATP